jgi:hypothetical protein
MASVGYGYSGISAVAAYRLAQKSGDAALQSFTKQKGIQREVQYFHENIGSVKDVDALFKDRRLAAFVLTGVDLGSEARYPVRAKKILSEKVDDSNAWMNKLVDSKWRDAAETLQFGERGLLKIKTKDVQDEIEKSYLKNQYNSYLEKQAPAAATARYFKEKAGSITSVYEILGDSKLRDFVTSTFNLPKEMAYQSVETQAANVQRRVNLKDLKNEEYVDKMIQRYLVQQDAKKTQSQMGGSSSILNLFA